MSGANLFPRHHQQITRKLSTSNGQGQATTTTTTTLSGRQRVNKDEGSNLAEAVNLFDGTKSHASRLSMASIQKLALEPTREHIENIRKFLGSVNAKDNSNQLISLVKEPETGIGVVCIKSSAKNAISAKMMCDFLDVIDQLYAWPEGKGVLIHGHEGFFCSGE